MTTEPETSLVPTYSQVYWSL